MLVDEIDVIDVDTHVTETPDLWTSRLGTRWVDQAPTVAWDERSKQDRWRLGDRWLIPVAMLAMAGWKEFPPSNPPTLADADPAAYDPRERIKRMDEFGIHAQVLYPNLIAFYLDAFLAVGPTFATACVQAYNDFLAEFASTDPDRLVPIMCLPYWDLEEALSELDRATELGHRGVCFAGAPEVAGLPRLGATHWDPLWSAITERNFCVNLHAGFGGLDDVNMKSLLGRSTTRAEYATTTAISLLSNARAISQLIGSGVCQRHPGLNFVSIESGFGWIPWVVESMDWQWQSSGVHKANPDWLLPSEYVRRQIFGSFWFERDSLALLEDWSANMMFETDFPHPTSISPGPASIAPNPKDLIEEQLGTMPSLVVTRVLHDNAARLYGLDRATGAS